MKRLQKIVEGEQSRHISLSDKTGNSAIVPELIPPGFTQKNRTEDPQILGVGIPQGGITENLFFQKQDGILLAKGTIAQVLQQVNVFAVKLFFPEDVGTAGQMTEGGIRGKKGDFDLQIQIFDKIFYVSKENSSTVCLYLFTMCSSF